MTAVLRGRDRSALRAFVRAYGRDRAGLAGLGIMLVFVLVALFAPLLADADGLSVTKATGPQLAPPSWDYPLGTDDQGRSVLTLVIWGSRISLAVGAVSAVIAMVIGATIGVLAGHFGGVPSTLLMRITDWFLVIPFLPLAIVLARVVGPSFGTIIIVIGVTSWPGTARLIRAQTLAIEGRPYLERARALGGGHWHQITRHVLPNVLPMVIANATLTVSVTILAETTLAFLGLGDPLHVSWGTIMQQAFDGQVITTGSWWWIGAPGIAVLLVVSSFNLCGRALERVLDPRLTAAS
jgi:peptide/nickel transport system permease protein